jgi:hypothetical protein
MFRAIDDALAWVEASITVSLFLHEQILDSLAQTRRALRHRMQRA